MKTEHGVLRCLSLCFLGMFTLDTKSSQAAPSNWIFDTDKFNLFSLPNTGRKIIRRTRSLNGETGNTAPIEPRIRDLPWYEEMERPCFPGESHLNPRNNFSWIMTDHLRDEDVLSIAGEENVARSYFNQAQSRLAHLSQKKHFHGGVSYADAPFSFLAHSQCPTESLNNMPNVGGLREIWTRDNLNSVTHHQLETAYKAFLHLSVAYKFMAMDWSEFGHSCVNPQTDNILHREYNLISNRFRDHMCFLMRSRRGGKQPTSSMRERLYADIKNKKVSEFHRQQVCSHRQRRDCAAMRQAREILNHFINLLRPTPR